MLGIGGGAHTLANSQDMKPCSDPGDKMILIATPADNYMSWLCLPCLVSSPLLREGNDPGSSDDRASSLENPVTSYRNSDTSASNQANNPKSLNH